MRKSVKIKGKKKSKGQTKIWVISGIVVAMVLCSSVVVVKALIREDEGSRRRVIQTVKLLKPPPPPKVEKLPEPEVKDEVIEEPVPEDMPEEIKDSSQDEQVGQDLALDADGVAGADGFGLMAKKGGRDAHTIGGGGSLKQKYAWYTRIVQEELHRELQKNLEKNGGIPKGRLIVTIKIDLDDTGKIVGFKIIKPSGNSKMDEVLAETLELVSISQPPPEDMPRSLKVNVSSQG